MEIKKYFVVAILAICFLSLIIGGFNSAVQNAKSEKAQKIKNAFSGGIPKIALIKLNGVIDASEGQASFLTDDYGAQGLLKSLKDANADKSVKAIIIKINSPGGTVATSQNIYHEIMRIRKNKPVVAVMEDVAASGGYYIASAADRIIAQEGTLTGSIGVIFQTMDAHKLLTEKLGIKSNVIKSGTFKDAGSASREMTPQERELFQNIINDAYGQFLTAIENGRIKTENIYNVPKRNLDNTTLKKYADGRIFTGKQAYEYGFVDMLGDMYLAEEITNKMTAQIYGNSYSKLPVVNYNSQSSFSQMLFGGAETLFKGDSIKSCLPKSYNMQAKLLYLWE